VRKNLIAIVLIAAYPLLVHASLVWAIPQLQVAAILLFLLGVFWHALWRGRLIPTLIYLGLSALILALGYWKLTLYLLYVPPIVIPLTLLIVFGRTLLPGREPLITAIGEAARGPLSAAMRRYTKMLTQLWCCVFLIMMVWSAILPWLQQPGLWSWFTNVINYGFVGALFGGEFLLRKKLFPEHNHPGFIEYIQIIIQSNIRH
jgi:uncharacterized membrane protein